MAGEFGLQQTSQTSLLTSLDQDEVIRYLQHSIMSGEHWYIALLEAIGLWSCTEESYNGRDFHYLIAGEAFDWLLLAERLCTAIDGLLPEEEKSALLFHSKPPLELQVNEFRQLIGPTKYHQYLNYFYGIVVEDALILAVQDEVRKERPLRYHDESDVIDEAHRRIYGLTKLAILKQFRKETGRPQSRSINLTELKEFTYWLFKYRIERCERARVASDTKKALQFLQAKGFCRKPIADKLSEMG